MSSPTNNGCPPDCGHADAEHIAFDCGLSDGERGRCCEDEFTDASERSAYQAGHSIGVMNREADNGNQITTLKELADAAGNCRSMICPKCPGFVGPRPAAFIISMQGMTILRMLESGMFIYAAKQ